MPETVDRLPPQVKYIVWNEGAERFSFYGMRSILTVYMVSALAFPEHEAKANFHWFVAACYLTPLLGAFLADRLWGRYRVILWISLGYVFGHALMAAWESRWGLFFALSLLALGSGGIKPCVSAFVGDQFRPEQSRLLERVYNLFYWMINLGSATSTLLIPELLARYGPAVAFAVPGVFMALALAIFLWGRRHYVYQPPSGADPHAFSRVVWHALRRLGTRPGHWLDGALDRHPEAAVNGAKSVFRIMGVYAAVTAFWALFDQHSASWVLQAQKMDLHVWGRTLRASQLAALNPWMVICIIPLFQGLLTSAEVLVSVTGLEFSYTQAPKSMKSTIMSIWFLTIFAGNLLTAVVSRINVFQGWGYFAFFTVLMLAAAVAFFFIARGYRPALPSAEARAA